MVEFATGVRPTAMRPIDIGVGLFFIAFAGLVLTQSLQLELYTRGIPGPGFFPTLLAVAIAGLGALLVVSRLRGPEAEFGAFTMPSRPELGRALTVWFAIVVASAVINLVGFVATSTLLIAVLLLGVERLRTLKAVLTVVLIPVFLYAVFGLLLRVRLPTGPWGF